MDGMIPMYTRFPARFIAAAISNGLGYHTRGFYLNEARRRGLRLLPLDVNASRLAYHGEDDWIRPGLVPVGDCRTAAMQVLVQEREANGPFADLNDLLGRVPLSRREAENLILAGGMGCFVKTRPELLRDLDRALPAAGRHAVYGPLGEREFCLMRKCLHESELLGCAVSADLREAVEIHSSARGTVRASELRRFAGRRIRVAGIPLNQRPRPERPGGEAAEFLTLGDATGSLEVGFKRREPGWIQGASCGGEPFAERLMDVTGMVRETEGEFWVEAEEARLAP